MKESYLQPKMIDQLSDSWLEAFGSESKALLRSLPDRIQALGLKSYVKDGSDLMQYPALQAIQEAGYQLNLSIGEQEENRIGSNCGRYDQKHLLENERLTAGYTYHAAETAGDSQRSTFSPQRRKHGGHARSGPGLV